jgi:nucleotide-binding universal stress UspA family protein
MQRILVPVDGSADSLRGVDAARTLCREGDETEIHLLNVQPRMHRHMGRFIAPAALAQMRSQRAEAVLDRARARLDGAPCSVRSAMRVGTLHRCIVGYAREQRIDRIIMGAARKNLVERLFTGSIMNRVIAEAEVPVMVVAGRRPGALERFGLPAGLGIGLTALVLGID